MQTYSHFLVNAFAGDRLRVRWPVRMGPLLAASILPDLPILILTGWYMLWRRAGAPAPPGVEAGVAPPERLFGPLYDSLFFHDPVWVASHNLLHAPLVIAALIVAGMWTARRDRSAGGALIWFGIGAGLHSAFDILTHHSDGPLLLFPFDWSVRFESPLSYWEADHHAAWVGGVEHALDLAIAAYFLVVWLRDLRVSAG